MSLTAAILDPATRVRRPRETPLLYQPDMARATLAGLKTVTRRMRGLDFINGRPDDWTFDRWQTGYPDGRTRAVVAYAGAVILTERPVWLARDAQNRLHCENRAAIEYSDGWGVYAWHGTRVPTDVILHPELLTAEQIGAEKNAEIRRVMIERFGADRYIRESGAALVAKDDFGELYRKPVEGDEPVTMVKVINSTPEHDGTRKEYWLRVHPELRPLNANGSFGDAQRDTARNAVASTFGMRGEGYAPVVET